MEPRESVLAPIFDVGDQLHARMAQLGQEHCVFARSGQLYAVGVGAAREVLIGESLTTVPQAPEGLVGVLNLRGEVLALLRLDTLLDLPTRPYVAAGDPVLVLSCSGIDLGVIVDRVRE
ncbi:MAG: chemotaxis protein CheW, partial [Deltaproteobacteria bacterium]|nr:chemotaxis protein CheW [Deltaproteobacteria bacterium]